MLELRIGILGYDEHVGEISMMRLCCALPGLVLKGIQFATNISPFQG
jgi:hypothetical protein